MTWRDAAPEPSAWRESGPFGVLDGFELILLRAWDQCIPLIGNDPAHFAEAEIALAAFRQHPEWTTS